jgi:WD40 repeat protein
MQRHFPYIAIIFILSLALSLSACGGTETSPPPTNTPYPTQPPPTNEPVVEPTEAPPEPDGDMFVEPDDDEAADVPPPTTFLPGGLQRITPTNVMNLAVIATLQDGGSSVAAFSPDGRWLAVGTFTPVSVMLYDLATGQARTLVGHDDPRSMYYLEFFTDSTLLVSGAMSWSDGVDSLILWDVASGTSVGSFEGYPGAFSHDWSKMAISTNPDRENDTLILFDVVTSEELGTIETETEILGVDFSPDDTILATRLREPFRTPITLWDVESLSVVRTLYDWHYFTFSPDDWVAAIIDDGSQDQGELKVFNMEDMSDNVVLSDETDSLFYTLPAFSPDGSLVVASFGDHLNVWSTDTWELVARLPVPERSGVAFSADGTLMATFSHHNPVMLWAVP